MKKHLKEIFGKFKERAMVASIVATTTLTSSAFCAPTGANTGNTDLDTLIGSMDTGAQSIKTGGLYIVAAIIVIAVVFFGARWLWNMWRSWLSRAQ